MLPNIAPFRQFLAPDIIHDHFEDLWPLKQSILAIFVLMIFGSRKKNS
jgi:hypothetical protein